MGDSVYGQDAYGQNAFATNILLGPSGDTTGATDFANLSSAIAQATANGKTILLTPGHYYVGTAYIAGTNFDYVIRLPASTNIATPTNLKIVGLGSGGQTSVVTSGPAVYTSAPGVVLLDFTTATPPTQTSVGAYAMSPDATIGCVGLTLTLENISILVNKGSSTVNSGGINTTNLGGFNRRDLTVASTATAQPASNSNGVGLVITGQGTNVTWSENVTVFGFKYGAQVLGQWSVDGSITIAGCYMAIILGNSSNVQGVIWYCDFLNISQCYYSIGLTSPTGGQQVRFYIGNYNNYYTTTGNWTFGADWVDPTNYISGIIVTASVINGTTTSYAAPTAATAGTANDLIIQSQVTTAGINSSFYPRQVATTGTTAVALQTGSTSILSTPTGIASALYVVMVNLLHITGTVAGTLTVTYTDNTSGVTATQSYTIASGAPGVSVSAMFLCNAKTGTAIAVAGTSATNSDIQATAIIYNAQ